VSEAKTIEQRLRVIEPFCMHGCLVAEVFISKIGAGALVTLEFDTDNGDTASLSLTPTEAADLMLWLKCALEIS
jgi:hypothetical protein